MMLEVVPSLDIACAVVAVHVGPQKGLQNGGLVGYSWERGSEVMSDRVGRGGVEVCMGSCVVVRSPQ